MRLFFKIIGISILLILFTPIVGLKITWTDGQYMAFHSYLLAPVIDMIGDQGFHIALLPFLFLEYFFLLTPYFVHITLTKLVIYLTVLFFAHRYGVRLLYTALILFVATHFIFFAAIEIFGVCPDCR